MGFLKRWPHCGMYMNVRLLVLIGFILGSKFCEDRFGFQWQVTVAYNPPQCMGSDMCIPLPDHISCLYGI